MNEQKQIQKLNNINLSFGEYKALINKRMQTINNELFEMFNEITQGKKQYQINEIHAILQDFKTTHLNNLYELLKNAYY